MKSWKTTVCGLIIAGAVGAQAYQGNNWKQMVAAVGIAIFGALVKDFNVSGTSGPSGVN